jgi:hypothetical protein
LESAANQLDEKQSSFTNEDWIYQGDVISWRRFANTLRLRLALRIADAEPELAAQHGTSVLSEDDMISSNADGAYFPHSSFARGAFYELHNSGQGMRNPSHFFVETMKNDGDPRISWYAEYSPKSEIQGAPDYVGVPNFLLASEINPDELNSFSTSYIGEYFQDEQREGLVMSYAESCFLQAEASLKGWGGSMSTEELYNAGVRAHMEYLDVNTDDIDEYLMGSGQFIGAVEQIAREKWKTFIYTDAIELYAEFRRTGLPVLTDEDGIEVDVDRIPRRFAYPNSELSLNGENVLAVGEGINDFETPVWWDVE